MAIKERKKKQGLGKHHNPVPRGSLANQHINVSHEIFFALRNRNVLHDYKIIKQLGEGAYGIVKLGVNKTSKIQRALKFIPKHLIYWSR